MTYNTKIKNKELYAEFAAGPGGTEWELSIDPAGLEAAATAYTTAATEYGSALNELKTTLDNALNIWDDKSRDTWTAKVKTARENLQAVCDAMTLNSTILNQISAAASATENSVSTGISSI